MSGSPRRSLLREPLLHFLVLGGLVFAVASQREPGVSFPQPREVTAPPLPSSFESPEQRERWLDEEALVRRARELHLDEVDSVVRRRLAQQARFLIEDSSPLPEPSDAQLETWLEANGARYAVAPRLDLKHVFLSRGQRGTRLQADAAELRRQLRSAADGAKLGDPFFMGSELSALDRAGLTRHFGASFANAVLELETGVWHGPVQSAYGLHFVWIVRRSAERPARLDEVRSQVLADWRAATRRDTNRRTLDALRSRYGLPPADSAHLPVSAPPASVVSRETP